MGLEIVRSNVFRVPGYKKVAKQSKVAGNSASPISAFGFIGLGFEVW